MGELWHWVSTISIGGDIREIVWEDVNGEVHILGDTKKLQRVRDIARDLDMWEFSSHPIDECEDHHP